MFLLLTYLTRFYTNLGYLTSFTNKLILPLLTQTQLIIVLYPTNLPKKLNWLPTYYQHNENLWVDGFLFDFLQKKTIDLWVRQWVIYTGFLFSERLVFDLIVRIILDNVIWPLHNRNIFETSNVSEVLSTLIFLYFTLLILFFTFYILYLI